MSSVTFLSGINADEMIKLRSVEIESRSVGWINCPITGNIKNYNYYCIRMNILKEMYFLEMHSMEMYFVLRTRYVDPVPLI